MRGRAAEAQFGIAEPGKGQSGKEIPGLISNPGRHAHLSHAHGARQIGTTDQELEGRSHTIASLRIRDVVIVAPLPSDVRSLFCDQMLLFGPGNRPPKHASMFDPNTAQCYARMRLKSSAY